MLHATACASVTDGEVSDHSSFVTFDAHEEVSTTRAEQQALGRQVPWREMIGNYPDLVATHYGAIRKEVAKRK